MRRTALSILLLLTACGGSADSTDAPAPVTFAVTREATGGPVHLSVRLSETEIGLAGTLLLEEEVVVEPGFVAELPEFAPDEFDGMGVTDIDVSPPERRGDLTVYRRRLTLEPERSGTLIVPAREAWFHREGEASESSVVSEPIEVVVLPIEDAAATALPEARPALTEEEAGEETGMSPWWALALLPIAAVAAVLIVRRRKKAEPPPRPAHEIAWEALRRLVALDLVAKGEIERFLVTLTEIVREYIERRYDVMAPERTTQEFLAEAARHPSLAAHRDALAGFLKMADMVKFARFTPEEAHVQQAFDSAKTFIAATQEEAGGGDA